MKRKLQSKLLLGIFLMFFCAIHSQAQTKTVSGTVKSAEDGTPLSGVSVLVQGSSSGTVTDANGKFSLSIPSGKAKIVFSYAGFISQTIDVNNKSNIDIAL